MRTLLDCDVPQGSVLPKAFVAAAAFRDACRAPLQVPPAGVVDLFFGIFGHHPRWIKMALIARNRLARIGGLAVPPDADILAPVRKPAYQAGDHIGPWPIFSVDDRELIAGRDNRHLDFRVSIYREVDGPAPAVVVSTVCVVHHWGGRAYLGLIVPFHRWGVRLILRRALRAGRI